MSTGKITTHALDLQRAKPAEGLKVGLWRVEGDTRRRLSAVVLNKDGRTEEPLLFGEGMVRGEFELLFEVGDYFSSGGGMHEQAVIGAPFQRVMIRICVADESQHYHIPLLIAPGGYSTYRGS